MKKKVQLPAPFSEITGEPAALLETSFVITSSTAPQSSGPSTQLEPTASSHTTDHDAKLEEETATILRKYWAEISQHNIDAYQKLDMATNRPTKSRRICCDNNQTRTLQVLGTVALHTRPA